MQAFFLMAKTPVCVQTKDQEEKRRNKASLKTTLGQEKTELVTRNIFHPILTLYRCSSSSW